MSTEENKAVVRRIYVEIISRGAISLTDDLYAPDMVEHVLAPGLSPGREGAKQWFAMVRTAFPDAQVTVEDMIAEGDKVVARVTPCSTHQGMFLGIPPTGKSFRITAIDIFRVVDGKIVEHWGNQDTLGLLHQLGAIPAPRQTE